MRFPVFLFNMRPVSPRCLNTNRNADGTRLIATMLLSYKNRLYPRKEQCARLERILEIPRGLNNDALTERRLAWKCSRVAVGSIQQAHQRKAIREFDEDAALINYSSIQQTLRRLDKSFQSCFERIKRGEKAGYPGYKGKKWFKSVCYVYNGGLRLKDDRLFVQWVGLIRMFQHRSIPENAKNKRGIIKRDKLGNWFVIFPVELPDRAAVMHDAPAVGIDMGLESFAALSTGELIDNPRWFRETKSKLGMLQKRPARCKRGSKQYQQLGKQITRLQLHISNQRRDFQPKLSTELVRRCGFIAVEDLNIQGLSRSHVRKSMGAAGWGYFLQKLAYKAEQAGLQLVKVNPNGTSQICSNCGFVVQKLLSERQHVCPHCGFTANRDVNAALNVLALGQRVAVKCTVSTVGGCSPL